MTCHTIVNRHKTNDISSRKQPNLYSACHFAIRIRSFEKTGRNEHSAYRNETDEQLLLFVV